VQTAEVLKSLDSSNSTTSVQEEQWTEVIEPHTRLLDLRLGDVWRYRDLVMMFVRRDFVANYKQTILGPLWFIIQPLLTTITFTFIFGNVAKLTPKGIPGLIFYMAGTTVWSYFSQSLTAVATVFTTNAAIFGKVYFPRLTMPLSIIISNLVRFGIQLALFLVFWVYYLITTDSLHPNWTMALTPLLVVLMGLLSMGLGIIFSALTTKYRDLALLLTFGVQLMMYAAPIVYPLSEITDSRLRLLVMANPITPVVETFRYAFLGSGLFSWAALVYSAIVTVLILSVGTIIFNKVEKNFTDTV
jgi:lipopolysaccharide transport system permease protein